jgi:hypothetical protein
MNGVSFNIEKYQIVSFSKNYKTFSFNYSISDTSLVCANVIKDLAIYSIIIYFLLIYY